MPLFLLLAMLYFNPKDIIADLIRNLLNDGVPSSRLGDGGCSSAMTT